MNPKKELLWGLWVLCNPKLNPKPHYAPIVGWDILRDSGGSGLLDLQ